MMKLKEPCSTRHCLIRRDPTSHGYLFTLTAREVAGGFSVRFFDALPDHVEPTHDRTVALVYWRHRAKGLNIHPDALRACYDLTGDALDGESAEPPVLLAGERTTREFRNTYQCSPVPVPPDVCIPGCVRDDPHDRARCIVPAPMAELDAEYVRAGVRDGVRGWAQAAGLHDPNAVARGLPSVAKRRSDLSHDLSHYVQASQYAADGQRIAMLEKTIATITEANRWQGGRVVELEKELAESRWELAESRKGSETQIAALEASLTIQRDAVKNREVEIEALEACNERQNRQMDNLRRLVGVEHFDEGIDAAPPPRPAVIHCQSQVDPDE